MSRAPKLDFARYFTADIRSTFTAYPDQYGIKPFPLLWGASDPAVRGPIIPSRLPSSIKQRNALGAHSGSYSIYRALAIAMGTLSPTHKPDYSKTEPAIQITPQPSWSDPTKIVSFDPWGHVTTQVFKHEMEELGLDIRPSIAVTKAHMKLSEIDEAARKGNLTIDGRVLIKSVPLVNADGTPSDADPGVEIVISKAAVEPVWYLPGVAERFGMYVLVSAGWYVYLSDTFYVVPRASCAARCSKIQEECTRSSSLDPISKSSFPQSEILPRTSVSEGFQKQLSPMSHSCQSPVGNPAYLSDESKELTLRVHDECELIVHPISMLPCFDCRHVKVTAPMYSDRTSVPASLISLMPSRNVCAVHSAEVWVSSSTSVRKAARWEK